MSEPKEPPRRGLFRLGAWAALWSVAVLALAVFAACACKAVR
jgi:hypothetical protein